MFNDLRFSHLQQWSLAVSLSWTAYNFGCSLGCLRIPMVLLCNTSIWYNQFLVLEASYGDNMQSSCCPVYPVICQRHLVCLCKCMDLQNRYGIKFSYYSHMVLNNLAASATLPHLSLSPEPLWTCPPIYLPQPSLTISSTTLFWEDLLYLFSPLH